MRTMRSPSTMTRIAQVSGQSCGQAAWTVRVLIRESCHSRRAPRRGRRHARKRRGDVVRKMPGRKRDPRRDRAAGADKRGLHPPQAKAEDARMANTSSASPIALPRRSALRRIAAGGLAFTAARGWAQSGGGRLVLGQSAAFTGPAAQLGIQMNQGAKLCFDAFNAAGGLGGLHIDLQTLDDGYEPARCKANTEKFLSADVFALFGYVGTP